MKPVIKLTPAYLVLFYALLGIAWISLSDKILLLLHPDSQQVTNVQTFKGMGFVLFTSLLLYLLVRNNNKRLTTAWQELLEKEHDYQLLFDHNPLPMMVYDLQTLHFLNVNKAAMETYGYREEEFMQMTILDVIPNEEQAGVKERIGMLQSGSYYISDDWHHQRKDHSIMPVQIASQAINYKGRKARIVMVLDITQRKKVEEELLISLNELDTFVYRASHDLRGPIARLLGMCKIAPMEVRTEGAAVYYNMLRQVAEEMDRTLSKLLLFNNLKKHSVDINRLELPELLDSIALQLHLKEHPEIRFTTELPDKEAIIYTDEYLFKLIMVNVLENAIKYRNTRPSHESLIRVKVYFQDEMLHILVADNGIGIEAEAQPRVFDMFYRGTTLSKGSGVGLSWAKMAAAKLGGDIFLAAAAAPFHTEFEIVLPNRSGTVAQGSTPFVI